MTRPPIDTDLFDAFQALREERWAQDQAAKEAMVRLQLTPGAQPDQGTASQQASRRRVYLASVMELDRDDDLPRALREGLNPNPTGPQRLSLLVAACATGALRAVQGLLDAGADPNRPGAVRPGFSVVTPLEQLVGIDSRERFDLGKLRALLNAGADPNLRSPSKYYQPLVAVAKRAETDARSRQALLLLLDAGADPYRPNHYGGSAYDDASPRIRALMEKHHRAWETRVLQDTASAAEGFTGPRASRTRARL